MKPIDEIFPEKIENIVRLIDEESYDNCSNVCRDLTRLSWQLELKDEIFIAETLDSCFDQIDMTVSEYKFPEEDLMSMKKKLCAGMSELLKFYKEKNVEGLYNSLREIRYVATQYQLSAMQKYPEKEQSRSPFLRRFR